MKDLFGNKNDLKNNYICFHDESKCEKSNYLYHGFLFVRSSSTEQILKTLIDIKETYYKREKEIHFTKFRNRSTAKYGQKTKVGKEWLKKAKEWLVDAKIRFYLFGINTNNIKDFWENKNSYEHNIYVRFFEIGLKSAIGWFSKFDNKYNKKFYIEHLYFDPNSEFNQERKEKVRWLSYELKNEKSFSNLNKYNVQKLDSDEKVSENKLSNLIQLTDVMLGVNRVAFVKISRSAAGQKECLEEFIDIIGHFTDSKKAYNPKADYYKKYAIQFFPTKDLGLTKEELKNKGINYHMKRGKFYIDRDTYKQKLKTEKQTSLFS
ncbi:MAG: hypothetical protein ACOCRX_12055 [Candidatus Woesearchaeota archaeon]